LSPGRSIGVATETEAVIGPASTLSAPKSRRCDIYVYRYGNRPDHTHLDRSHEVPNTVHGRQESKAAPALSSRQLIAGEGSLGHLDRAGCGATEEKARTSASKVVDEKARNAAPAAKLRKLNTGSAGRFVATPIGDGADWIGNPGRHQVAEGIPRSPGSRRRSYLVAGSTPSISPSAIGGAARMVVKNPGNRVVAVSCPRSEKNEARANPRHEHGRLSCSRVPRGLLSVRAPSPVWPDESLANDCCRWFSGDPRGLRGGH